MPKKKPAFDPEEHFLKKLRKLREKHGSTVHDILKTTDAAGTAVERWTCFNFVVYWRSGRKEPFTDTEAIVAGFTALHTDVENGGFHQYFANAAGNYWKCVLQVLVDGKDKKNEARFREVLAVFPSSSPSLDREERNAQLAEIRSHGEDKMWDFFAKHSRIFYETPYPSEETLWKALRNRPDETYIPEL